jgi:hypothetical protein
MIQEQYIFLAFTTLVGYVNTTTLDGTIYGLTVGLGVLVLLNIVGWIAQLIGGK